MFPNLEAEQARQGHTNAYVAEKLGVTRASYEKKKKIGCFKLKECIFLAGIYKSSLDYLFSQEPTMHQPA